MAQGFNGSFVLPVQCTEWFRKKTPSPAVKKSYLRELGRRFKAHFDCGSPVRSHHASLEALRRQQAILQAEMMGAQSHMGEFAWNRGALFLTRGAKRRLRDLVEKTGKPCLVLDPRPGLRIVDLNDAYAAATLTDRRKIAGDKLFSVFPDNPHNPGADGVCNLFESLRKSARDCRADVMVRQRYDMRDVCGRFVERHWQSVNAPVLDARTGHLFAELSKPCPIAA